MSTSQEGILLPMSFHSFPPEIPGFGIPSQCVSRGMNILSGNISRENKVNGSFHKLLRFDISNCAQGDFLPIGRLRSLVCFENSLVIPRGRILAEDNSKDHASKIGWQSSLIPRLPCLEPLPRFLLNSTISQQYKELWTQGF